MITLKMKINEPETFYFEPTLLNVEEIQLQELWVSLNSYFIFFDIIDSSYSITNFENDDKKLRPSESNLSLKTDRREISNFTLSFENTDMSAPTKDDTAILNLKITHN